MNKIPKKSDSNLKLNTEQKVGHLFVGSIAKSVLGKLSVIDWIFMQKQHVYFGKNLTSLNMTYKI